MLKNFLRAKAAILAVALVLANGVGQASELGDKGQSAGVGGKGQAAEGGVKGQAPTTAIVRVKEWVPETYMATRTCYTTEYVDQEFTSYRCEKIPVTRVRTITKYRCEKVMEQRTVQKCHYEWVCEEKTTMKPHLVCKPVTKTVCKTVDCGHYECVETPICDDDFVGKGGKGGKGTQEPISRTKSQKVWVPNLVTESHEVTHNKLCIEYEPCTKMVKVRKPYYTEHTVNVCVRKQIPYTVEEEYCSYDVKQIPVTTVRKVPRTIPHTEQVECTRMVCRTVEKEVPVTECCEAPCRDKKFGGIFHRVCRPGNN